MESIYINLLIKNGYGGLVGYFVIGIDIGSNYDSAKCMLADSAVKNHLRISVSLVCGNVSSS